MRRAYVHFLAAFALLATGCGGSARPEDSSRVRIEIPSAALAAAGVARVLVTVSSGQGPGFASFGVELTRSADSWAASTTGLPAGPQRQFDFQALDSAGKVLLTASVRGDVPAGGALVISAVLQPGAPAPQVTYLPVIDALTASAPSVPPGGTVSLSASAHVIDAGDTFSFAWQATCGSLSSAAGATVVWTAPATSGVSCTVTVTVSGHAGSVGLSIPLTVQ